MNSQLRKLSQCAAAEELEQYLGDPSNPENPFSFQRSVELDEKDEYPEESRRILSQWGYMDHFIPVEFGGKLKYLDESFLVTRMVSRRDLTVAVALAQTFVGALPVWVEGTAEQRSRLASTIKSGGQAALFLTEEAHGSDILATEARTKKVEKGYRLSGEKWIINNGTLATAMSVFARVDAGDGRAEEFSLFLVEKSGLDASAYSNIPRIKTLGIRGIDLSGIRFDNCFIPDEALLGRLGFGPELVLKGLQISRATVAPISLGAGDTALRATVDFALSRKLYGDAVFNIPYAQSMLVDAFLDLLICDCLGTAASRLLHVLPQQFSVVSAVVKYFIPTTIESMIRNLSVVLGARYYLRQSHWAGVFQKIVRDNVVLSLFDGSTAINLNVILHQLPQLSTSRVQESEKLWSRLEQIFALERRLPDLDLTKLALFNAGEDDVLQGLEASLGRIRALKGESGLDPETTEMLAAFVGQVIAEARRQERLVADALERKDYEANKSPELFELAKRYCALHAAAACIHMWVCNRKDLSDFFARGEWLALCLRRLMLGFRPSPSPAPRLLVRAVAQELARLYREDRLFSILPIQLARTAKTGTVTNGI